MEHTQLPFVSKLPIVMACIEETQAELSAKKLEVLEVKLLGGDSEELESEWGALETKMDRLVHTADMMRKNLLERGLLETFVTKERNKK
nr:hypothetical protein [Tanacetum cinerariifolium]GEV01258.1 hypothetical protein [Tanacetum cinerariifolium]